MARRNGVMRVVAFRRRHQLAYSHVAAVAAAANENGGISWRQSAAIGGMKNKANAHRGAHLSEMAAWRGEKNVA